MISRLFLTVENIGLQMENNDTATFKPVFKTRKKNDYVKLQEGAYPSEFEGQIEKAITAVATGRLRETRMVRRDKRSGDYLLTMGYGKRLWWFKNNFIEKGHVAPFGTIEEVLDALRDILDAARAGVFDHALEDLRKMRQDHATTMMDARDTCGFHRRKKGAADPIMLMDLTEPMKLLAAPKADVQPSA